MSTVKADTVQPKDFATDLTLGASGDTVTVAADSIVTNKVQDKGGNTLWDYSTGAFVSPKVEFASQSLKLLATAAASNTGSVFFTTIDSTYDVYMFKFYDINAATDEAYFQFQGSTDGGSSYGITITSTAFYARHTESDNAALLGYSTGLDLAQSTNYQPIGYRLGNDADQSASGELYLFNPSSTTYVKHWWVRMSVAASDGGPPMIVDNYMGGYFNNTVAINALNFKMTSGNFDGTIKMYGLL